MTKFEEEFKGFKKNTPESKWLIDTSDEYRIEDLKEIKKKKLNKLKRSNSPNYHGYKFEFDIWLFFLSLKPNFISDITRQCKFDFSENKNKNSQKIDGEYLKAYQEGKQSDVVAIFGRHIFVVECKSTKGNQKYSGLKKEMALSNSLRGAKDERIDYLCGDDRFIHISMFAAQGFTITREEHLECLKKNHIVLFSEKYREYIETVRNESQSGEFAYLQLLSFFRSGKPDYGSTTIDAFHSLSGKNKKHKVYTFSISPEQMLKISTVMHQRARLIFDSHDIKKSYYQRLLKKGRINEISKWLTINENPFPNNIIVSYRGNKPLRWDPSGPKAKEKSVKVTGNASGKLQFDACPGTFHVVDGQHRLFSYTGIDKKSVKGLRKNHRLLVTAFEGMSAEEEANLFLEVNTNAKPVNAGLIMEIQYSSEEVFLDNLATAIVFNFRDKTHSALYQRINQAEGRKAELQPKNMQSAFKPLDIINGTNFVRGSFWKGDSSWLNLIDCADLVFENFNAMLQIVQSKNQDICFKKRKQKQSGSEEFGIYQDIIMQGIFLLFDRITMEVIRNSPKDDREILQNCKQYASKFADNLKKHDRKDLSDRVFFLKTYTYGGGAAKKVVAMLVDLFMKNDFKNLQYSDDLEILKVINDSDGRSKDEMLANRAEYAKSVRAAIKECKKLPTEKGHRFSKAGRYHNLVKKITQSLFSSSDNYNGEPWQTIVIPAKLEKEEAFKKYLELHKKDQLRSSNIAPFPTERIEGEDLKKMLNPYTHLKALPMGVPADEREERKNKVIKYIWDNLVILKDDDLRDLENEQLDNDCPEFQSKYWKKGFDYIDIFYDFRNKSDGEDLDSPHLANTAAAVEKEYPIFDDYEKKFIEKVKKIALDFEEIEKGIDAYKES